MFKRKKSEGTNSTVPTIGSGEGLEVRACREVVRPCALVIQLLQGGVDKWSPTLAGAALLSLNACGWEQDCHGLTGRRTGDFLKTKAGAMFQDQGLLSVDMRPER